MMDTHLVVSGSVKPELLQGIIIVAEDLGCWRARVRGGRYWCALFYDKIGNVQLLCPREEREKVPRIREDHR